MIANQIPHLSPAEYLEWEEKSEIKHEYMDGEIYAMAGSSDDHAAIVSNVIMTSSSGKWLQALSSRY